MTDSLDIRRTLDRAPRGSLQILDGPDARRGLRKVMRQQLGLSLDQKREASFEDVGNAAVQALPLCARQRGISGIPYESVLENVSSSRELPVIEINSEAVNCASAT